MRAPAAMCIDNIKQFIAGTTDCEALVVKQITNSADHDDFMVLVVATVTAALHGTQLREFLLPVAEYVRFDAAQVTHLTDGEVTFCRNGWEGFLQLNQCAGR